MAQLSLNELIIRKTSVQLNQAESIVEKVIQHKYKSVYDAQYLYKSVEDSGLGTFNIRSSKVISRLKALNAQSEAIVKKLQNEEKINDEIHKEKLEKILDGIQEEIKYLESKI